MSLCLVARVRGEYMVQSGECWVDVVQVGTDFLEEEITKFEDIIQSVDIAAFNKI